MSRERKDKSGEAAGHSGKPQGTGDKKGPKPRLTARQRARLAQATRDEVYRKAEEMVGKMIEDVKKKGSHTTAKFLFQFAGIDQIPLNEKQRKQAEDSLAALLLREIHAQPSESDSAEVAGKNVHLTQ